MVSRYLEYFKMILYLTIFSVYFTHATMLSSTVPMTALINNKDEHSTISSLQRSKAENSNNNIKLTSISTASTTPRYTMTGFGYNNDELFSTKQLLSSTTSISLKIEMQRANQIRTRQIQDSTKAIDRDYTKHIVFLPNDMRGRPRTTTQKRDSNKNTEDEIHTKPNILPLPMYQNNNGETEGGYRDTEDENDIKHDIVGGLGIAIVMIVVLIAIYTVIRYDVCANRCNNTVAIADVNYANSQEEQEFECIDMKSFDSSSHPDDDYVPEDNGFTYEHTFSQPHSYEINYSDESDYRVEYGITEETKYEHFTYN